jgi:hypothetical protein
MASNRCFTTSNKTIQNASDYSTSIKQQTIYKDVAQNMSSSQSGNPKKNDGNYYNNNFGVISSSNTNTNGCLVNAKNYELLLDVTKGQSLYNANNGINQESEYVHENDAWAGNLFSVNYNEKGVNVVVDTSYNGGNANKVIYPQPITASAADLSANTSYPGVIVDPSYMIFYEPCLSSFNDNKNSWMHLVDVSFNTTNYYQTAVKNNPFSKFSYPQQVIFSCTGTS